ncbi:MAG TPA: IPT/TIG domain-containing protein, partial [Acidimicrobiales bacterium]|nr:IPT/TIG domain-containing protein [Acidimicrobiales bacterium]
MAVAVSSLASPTYAAGTATVTAVGTLTSADARGLTTLGVSPKTAGDVLAVFAKVSAAGPTVTSISGGGASTWTKAVQFVGSVGGDEELWYGKITTTGASTVTFTWSSSVASDVNEYGAQEFSSGLGASTVWTTDKTGTLNGASSTSVPFPGLTPSASGELYFGYSLVANNAAAGTTTGFTYAVTAEANAVAYDTNVSGAVAPVAAQSPAGTSSALGILLSASTGAPPPPPTVTGVSPASGTTAGGTTVTITGTNFTGANAVKFGTVAAATFTVTNAGSITAVSPAEGAATVDVTVSVGATTSAINKPSDQFTFTLPPPPTVTGVSPSTGSTAGGTSVTISGTNFNGASAVKFGTVSATTFTVNNAGSITAASPAEGAATVDVTVTVGATTSAVNQPGDQFTFTLPPPPTVTGVSPSTGSTAGGTTVTISGTNFTGANAVKFGTVSATTFTVNNAGSITATSPAEGAATVDVTVTVGANTSAVNQPGDQFTFKVPPVAITAVGTFTSGEGSGLTTLPVSPKTAGDVLAVFAKASATGPTVTSISGGGVSTWTKAVRFNGSIGGDEELWYGKITTTGASTVTFTWSSSVASDFDEYGAQEFSSGLGASTVWATDKTGTLNGVSSTSVPLPSLTSSGIGELYFGYSLVANNAAAGTTLGFTYAVTAEVNAVAYDTNVSGAVSPVATQSPAGTSSAVGMLLSASTGAPPPPPTVTAVSPGTGPTTGGTSVTITGTNFTGVTAVNFGSGNPATSFTV